MDDQYELRDHDVESAEEDLHLYNGTVDSFSWESIGVRLYDKSSKTEKCLLQSVDGEVKAGKFVPYPNQVRAVSECVVEFIR